MDGQQGLATAIRGSGMQHDLGLRCPDFDQLAGPDLAGRHRVEIRVEGDEAVLADMAEIPLGDHIRRPRKRAQGHVVPDRAETDDLAVGAVDLRPPQRHPSSERGVEFLDRGEGPAGQDVVADDQHLSLDPAIARGPIGGQHVGIEVVMPGEGDGLRMEGDGFTWCNVPARRTTVLVRS